MTATKEKDSPLKDYEDNQRALHDLGFGITKPEDRAALAELHAEQRATLEGLTADAQSAAHFVISETVATPEEVEAQVRGDQDRSGTYDGTGQR